jgi:CheY-like chemotaxis protein
LADDAPILVVDSDPAMTVFLIDLLMADGNAVAYALDGPEALEKAARELPELMVLGDLAEPRDTFDVIASVRAGYAGLVDPQLPILVPMTSSAGRSATRCCARASMRSCVEPAGDRCPGWCRSTSCGSTRSRAG